MKFLITGGKGFIVSKIVEMLSNDGHKITIVDNSNLHKSHKFFSKDKFHLQLNIKSLYLSSMSRLNSQKLVMKVLKEELKNKIHALQISIEK